MTTLREEIVELTEQIERFARMRENSPMYRESERTATTARTYRRVAAWLNSILEDHPPAAVECIPPTRLHVRQGVDRLDQGAP